MLSGCQRKVSLMLFALIIPGICMGSPRIKDIAKVGSNREINLIGYGLVVGLDGTGDSKGTEFTIQSVVNMLARMGITVPQQKVRTKNVAAVMVSASLPTTAKRGTRLDATVSSIGDAKSLQGGTLLLTPLISSDGRIYAYAQGAVSVGGFKVAGGGEVVAQNHTLVGRIPGGAVVEEEAQNPEFEGDYVDIMLFESDYTTAARVAEAIQESLNSIDVSAVTSGLVRIKVPDDIKLSSQVVQFIAKIETTRVEPDVPAVVVINERTGTIVAGANISVGEAAIAHGNLSIEIRSTPYVSQPLPFSKGETTVIHDTEVRVEEGENRILTFSESATVEDVARALNELGVSPRDAVAIFQALKQAGALRAEIRIM
ncbi:MAG: flagellar basal body P-ring protein FlgI [bacterium]